MSAVVLGIDTSGSWCSAAIVRGDEAFARRADVGNAHSDHLLAMVDAVLGDAGLALDGCDAIAFGAGPGSFTGLRIACAAAQGLAFGAALPVAPIGTLDAIARAASRADPSAQSYLVAQDARMGEVYWSLFEATPDGWSPVRARRSVRRRPSSRRCGRVSASRRPMSVAATRGACTAPSSRPWHVAWSRSPRPTPWMSRHWGSMRSDAADWSRPTGRARCTFATTWR